MNLRNNQITLGELLDNPPARAILEKNFGALLAHPLLSKARNMTLAQILELGKKQLPPQIVAQTLEELQAL